MHETMEFLGRHGYWVLFVWVLVEQLGAPVPSVPMLLAMGALIGFGRDSLASAAGVALLASMIADTAWYVVGRRKGASVLRLLCRISLEPDSCVSSTRDWFKRLDGWALVVAKFVPGLSTIAAPMAGLLRMPWWRFLSTDGAGILIWSGAYFGVGYVFREQLEDAGALALRLGGWLLAAIVAAMALWIGGKFWQRKRFIKSLRVARIAPEDVFDRLADFAIVDLRSATEVALDRMKLPGAVWFDPKELAERHEEIPRDRDVVLYCT